MEELLKLLKKLKIKPKNADLYLTAFTHRSYLNESAQTVESNERLEFLGDAILSCIVSHYLYTQYPQHTEGVLTNMRSTVVRTVTLAQLSIELNFGTYLRLSKGEEEGGGRTNPSLLADTFEAFLGAVFLDQGMEASTSFLSRVLLVKVPTILEEKLHTDYKSKLQEIVQTFSRTAPTYKVVKTEGPDHAKRFWVRVVIDGIEHEEGIGRSKQEAQQQAAFKTLEKMGKL